MTIREANAVNTICNFLLGPQQGGKPPLGADVVDALGVLADSARKPLLTGWTSGQVRQAWVKRIGDAAAAVALVEAGGAM